ncbi:uncharacterized protein [Palaemon carinicauda]|uniref:uncharacterized protein n=1 Tax=Palaemon carinicauda TaxID=392227 RepID=UPI0035B64124
MNGLAVICLLAVGVSAVPAPQFRGLIGQSGIVRPDGRNVQFTQAQADNFLLVGPSGIVTKDGRNIQLTDDLQFVHRGKRSAGFVSAKGNIGHSGILRADGTTDLFSHDQAHNILLIGPSGIVTKDGRNMQLTDDLRIAHRSKRHLIGDSGMITADGIPIQFSRPGVTILLEGPSAYVMSDGTLVQKRAKRSLDNFGHTVGDSGIITNTGKLIQLPAHATVVQVGPSGAILSNGQNVQF